MPTLHINSLFFKALSPVLTFAQGKRPEFLDELFSEDEFVSRREYNKLYNEHKNTYAKMAKLHADYEKLAGIRVNMPNENIGIILAEKIMGSFSGRSELIINKENV